MQPGDICLPTPYFSQRLSHTGQNDRMCFSACCAMASQFIHPHTLNDTKWTLDEDDYLEDHVVKYGDTTNYAAQIKALADLKVKGVYSQSGSWEKVDAQLHSGHVCAIGILHHGSLGSTLYGGHWILVIGKEAKTGDYICNDPYGKLDLVNSGYSPEGGEHVRYNAKQLGQRWMVEGNNTGWWMSYGAL